MNASVTHCFVVERGRSKRPLGMVSFVFVLSFLAGCSTLPESVKNPPAPDLVTGNDYLRRGEFALRTNSLGTAVAQFARGYERFTLADDINGKITASLQLSRAYFRADSLSVSSYWRERAKESIEIFAPERENEYRLLLTEMLFLNAAYDSVIVITNDIEIQRLNAETNSQLIAYRLMALLQRSPLGDSEQRDIAEHYRKLHSGYKHLRSLKLDDEINDALVVSFSAYVLGYTDSKLGRWNEAIEWFMIARNLDARLSNYRGIADNLYGLAIALQKVNRDTEAQGYFERAGEIFYSIGQMELGARAEVKALSLKLKRITPEHHASLPGIYDRLRALLSVIENREIRREISSLLGQ